MRVAVEDIYTLPGLADGIKRNARANVADLLESELVDALFSTSADAAPTAASTTVSYSAWRKLLADAVEGKLAGTVRDVRALVNVESLAKLETVDASTSYALSAADFAREKAGGIRASVHAPDTSSNDAEVSLILGRHAGSIVQPVWSGATVTIEDKYSDAAKGEIVFTLLVIADTVIARSAAFKRESIQLA